VSPQAAVINRKWPRKLTRGVLRGKTFGSESAYLEALAAARNGRPKAGMSVAEVIDGYEVLIGAGVGKRAAIKVLDALDRGRR